jgi:hypothetical protein
MARRRGGARESVRGGEPFGVRWLAPWLVWLATAGGVLPALAQADPAPPPGHVSTPAAAAPAPASAASQPALALYGPAPVMHIGGQPVSWAEFYFWLQHVSRHYKTQHGLSQITDWQTPQSGLPLADFFLQTAETLARQNRAVQTQAQALGLRVSEAEEQALQARHQANIKIYGTLEYRRILTRMYGSQEVFDALSRTDILGQRLFSLLYGSKGEKCDEACVADYVAREKLHYVKYIFVATQDAKGQPLPPTQQGEKLSLMRALQARLSAATDATPLLNAAIAQHGEDEAMLQDPEGRLVATGIFGPEFDAAYANLPEGGLSAVVPSQRGYYLLQRLPVTGDAQAGGQTLRYWAAYNGLFKPQVARWAAALPVVHAPVYGLVDVPRFFQ